jgi:hypothetical protein
MTDPSVNRVLAALQASTPAKPAAPGGVEGSPWVTADMQSARAARAKHYKDVRGGLEEIVERGLADVRPTGVRILMRAILVEDAYSTFSHVAYDARQAVCFEVISISPACEAFWNGAGVPDEARDKRGILQRLRAFASGRGSARMARPRPGDHVWLASADADRLSGSDPACRLWSVHPEDLPAFWTMA